MTGHVLMCRPSFYQVEYEINPWMHRSVRADSVRAMAEWEAMRALLIAEGVKVELVDQRPGLPDMTFTANAGIVTGRRFVVSTFRYPQRQPEAEPFADWFRARGYSVSGIHQPHYWEGEGDVLDAGSAIYAGYRFRTEERSLDHLDELLGTTVTRLELVDPRFYHLDTCLCPLAPGWAMLVPGAFAPDSLQRLRASLDDAIEVDSTEALRFACNAIVTGNTVIMNTGCPGMEAALAKRGFRVRATPTDEFIKAGGSAKCLALTLDSFTGTR